VDRFTDEERQGFARAASAALATKERMELLREQVAEAEGGPGTMAVEPGKARSVAAPGEDLMRAVEAIMRAHPKVAAVRFRGHIFSLLTFQGMKVMSVLPERAIADFSEPES
jgi:hypothetical protein